MLLSDVEEHTVQTPLAPKGGRGAFKTRAATSLARPTVVLMRRACATSVPHASMRLKYALSFANWRLSSKPQMSSHPPQQLSDEVSSSAAVTSPTPSGANSAAKG